MSIARQLVQLLTRTRARLDGDLSKVRFLQGEEDIRSSVIAPLSSPYGTKHHLTSDTSVIALSPIIQIGQSLRTGLGKSDTIHSISAPSGLGYNKSKSPLFSARTRLEPATKRNPLTPSSLLKKNFCVC